MDKVNSAVSLFIVALITLISSCSPNAIVKSYPQRNDIVIDGNLAEWPQSGGTYSSTENLGFIALNSPNILFLSIKLADYRRSMEALKSGLIIWLDNSGRKKRISGIEIPPVDPNLFNQMEDFNNLRNRSNSSTLLAVTKDSLIRSISHVNIIHNSVVDRTVPLLNDFRLDIAISNDPSSDGIIYELAIPIQDTLSKKILPFRANPGEVISIGLEYKHVSNNPYGVGRANSPVSFGVGFGMGGLGMGYPGSMNNLSQAPPAVTWMYVSLTRNH